MQSFNCDKTLELKSNFPFLEWMTEDLSILLQLLHFPQRKSLLSK